MVVTSGTTSERLQSIFPRGIPIGEISRVDTEDLDLYRKVHLKPFADFRRIDYLTVLTDKPQVVPDTAQAPGTPTP
jgi:cell shape-determining protein MreC